jgi:hypothetical protein
MSIDNLVKSLSDEVDKLSLATVRVRGLHKKMTHIYGKVACTECGQAWPCQTIQALDGEQS